MAPALLDTNVLVCAMYRRAALHAPAAILLDRALNERGLYCVAPQNLIEFAAVVSRRRQGDSPLPAEEIFRVTDVLYRSRTLTKIYPRRGTVARVLMEGAELGTHGSAWYDLFLALTMRDAGVRIIVTENASDFQRFAFVSPRKISEISVGG